MYLITGGSIFVLVFETMAEMVVYRLTCLCPITRAAITSLFLRFVLILMVCVLENIFVLISKICPYFDLCPYFCFISLVKVL